jgi:hypothetical protein
MIKQDNRGIHFYFYVISASMIACPFGVCEMIKARFVMLSVSLLCLSLQAMANHLMVEVRIEGQSAANQQGVGIGTQGIQGGQRTVTRRETSTQRLMVMDGGTATLSSVQTEPLRLRQVIIGPYGKIISQGYVYRSLGGGIRVTPRSRGEMVDIEVGAEEAKPVPGQYQATEVMQLSTQISGRMGEWIMLGDDQRGGSGGGNRAGGGYDSNGGSAGGIGTRSDEYSSGQKVWLRVLPSSY